eukprot:1680711-Pyramimonas_sp.AAC.1
MSGRCRVCAVICAPLAPPPVAEGTGARASCDVPNEVLRSVPGQAGSSQAGARIVEGGAEERPDVLQSADDVGKEARLEPDR